MTEFKIGDEVRRINSDNSPFTTVGVVGTITRIDRGFVTFKDRSGQFHACNNPRNLELAYPPLKPTKEQAIDVLTSLGYTITEPKPKLTGRVWIKQNNVTGKIEPSWNDIERGWTIIAVVDWTKGEGI